MDWGDPTWVMAWNRMYAGALPLDDPRVSPLLGDCSELPRLLVVAGGAELLADDAKRLVAKARAAGVNTSLILGEDMVHGYAAFGGVTPRAEEAMQGIADFLTSPTS